MSRSSKQGVVHAGTHQGVRYSLVKGSPPGAWHYTFEIGPKVKTGRVQSRLTLLAIKRLMKRIDRELSRSAAVGTLDASTE